MHTYDMLLNTYTIVKGHVYTSQNNNTVLRMPKHHATVLFLPKHTC